MQGKARGYPRLLNLRKLPETLKMFLPYLVLYSAQKHETFDSCWDNFDLICCSRTKSWAISVYISVNNRCIGFVYQRCPPYEKLKEISEERWWSTLGVSLGKCPCYKSIFLRNETSIACLLEMERFLMRVLCSYDNSSYWVRLSKNT